MKILNYGSLNVDYVYYLKHAAKTGETLFPDRFEIHCGGKGLNQSIALSRAGANVYHAGKVGRDGDILIEALNKNNINSNFVKKIEAQNGNAFIQIDENAENTMLVYPGTNHSITKEEVDEVFKSFEKGDYLMLQNEINLTDYIIKKAKEKGMIIAINIAPMNNEALSLPLDLVDYIILNQQETSQLSRETDINKAILKLKSTYKNTGLLITLGKQGSVYIDNDIEIHQDIFKVDAVDTVGAGDTFTGFFIGSLMSGKDIKTSLTIAAKASSICVTRKGAADSIPLLEEVNI